MAKQKCCWNTTFAVDCAFNDVGLENEQKWRLDFTRVLRFFPGPWLLEEIVKSYNMAISSVADQLMVTRPSLSRFLNGRAALTTDIAIRFKQAFGILAKTMLGMQSAYYPAQAKLRAETIDIERLPCSSARSSQRPLDRKPGTSVLCSPGRVLPGDFRHPTPHFAEVAVHPCRRTG